MPAAWIQILSTITTTMSLAAVTIVAGGLLSGVIALGLFQIQGRQAV